MATLPYHSTIKLRPTTPFSHKNPTHFMSTQTTLFRPSSYSRIEPQKVPFRISSVLAPKARFVARRKETVQVQQLQRPLCNVSFNFFLPHPFIVSLVHFGFDLFDLFE